MGSSVAYKPIGPFLSKVRCKDASGQSTEQSKGGCSAAVRDNHRQALVPGPNYQLHIEFTVMHVRQSCMSLYVPDCPLSCSHIILVGPSQGFAYPPWGGGGLIQGPTHPEFWHTHRPTNVPPPGGGGGLTPTHPPTHPRTQLRPWAWGTHSNCGVLALPPSHLTQMTMHPSPFMGVGHAHVICNAM